MTTPMTIIPAHMLATFPWPTHSTPQRPHRGQAIARAQSSTTNKYQERPHHNDLSATGDTSAPSVAQGAASPGVYRVRTEHRVQDNAAEQRCRTMSEVRTLASLGGGGGAG